MLSITKTKPFKYIVLLQLFVGFFYSLNVQAHPHSWMDMKTTIVGDKTSITGFEMSWTFDAMTSFYMLEGQTLTDENREKILAKISAAVMDNLVLEHYFSYFYDGETPIPYASTLEGKIEQDKTQLRLSFFIPLAEPKPFTTTPLKLQVYETSYYVDMSWREDKDVQLSPELADLCSIHIEAPNPTPQQLSYAMSLPADAQADHALGSIFTQTLILQCDAGKG